SPDHTQESSTVADQMKGSYSSGQPQTTSDEYRLLSASQVGTLYESKIENIERHEERQRQVATVGHDNATTRIGRLHSHGTRLSAVSVCRKQNTYARVPYPWSLKRGVAEPISGACLAAAAVNHQQPVERVLREIRRRMRAPRAHSLTVNPSST